METEMSETPVFEEMAAAHPEVIEAMEREPWSYQEALARIDAAIAAKSKRTRKRTRK